MKKHLLIIILVFLSSQLISQENNDSLKITQFNIKTSPLTIVDPTISSAQIALEYRHKQNYAIEVSYYTKTPSIFTLASGKKNEKLLEYKGELRRFFQDEVYLALEYGHIDYQYDYFDDVLVEESIEDNTRDISLYNYESASYRKVVDMFNFKFGVEYNSRKHPRLLFDFFIGAGVRKVNLNYSDVQGKKKMLAFASNTQRGHKYENHTFGIEQANGTYVITNVDQVNPPSNAVDLGRNAQGVTNSDGTFNHVITKTPVWDLSPGSSLRGNFTFGIKIGYTLWSKY